MVMFVRIWPIYDIIREEHYYNQQQHKNLNNQTRKPQTYQQTKPNDTEAWFRDLSGQETDLLYSSHNLQRD